MGAQYVDYLERTVERQASQIAGIQAVIDNLENTIRGKRALLADMDYYSGPVNRVSQEFLRINVDELQRILDDLRKVDGDEAAGSN